LAIGPSHRLQANDCQAVDGAMGFWAAMDEVYPTTRRQRCWQHKTMNVLNCLPKLSQPKAKAAIHNIWQAKTNDDAEKAFDLFVKIYEPKYPKATLCLQKDREELMAFFDFPAQHWQSIRTSNPIESAFATIRHRTKRSKGCLSPDGMLHIPLVTFLRNALPGNGCSSWDNALSKTGENYAALITWPKSSQASRSKTELKPQNPTRSPHDRQTSNTRFDNNSIFSKLEYKFGGGYRNRTGLHGFAIRYVTSPPTRRRKWL
jgi:hypothetical protein